MRGCGCGQCYPLRTTDLRGGWTILQPLACLKVYGDDASISLGGGEGVVKGHYDGGHVDREPVHVRGDHGRALHLDGRPHILGVLEVYRRQRRDPLGLDLFHSGSKAEEERIHGGKTSGVQYSRLP